MSVAQPLRISYIDLRSAKDVEYIEVLFPGCRRSIRRQDKNHFREEFPEPLTVQGEALSFSVHRKKRYPFRIPAVDNIQIDVREVLSDSRPHKFQTKRSKLDITIGLSSNRLSADVVLAQDNPTPPNTNSLRATTEELLDQCPRFRILVIGQSGVGKSTLLQRVFGIDQASAENLKPGAANIEEELISPQNDRFVLHDSNGFEPGDNVNYDAVRSFITDRKKRKHVKDQLHAVWLCFRMPIKNRGDRLLEDGAEAFLEKDTSVLQNIPTIVVFTKYDKLLTHMQKEQKANPEAAAEQYLKEHCYAPIEELAGGADLSYVAVSSFENPGLDERRRRLINLTHRKVIERFRLQTDTPSPVSIVFLLAQRMLSDSPGSKLLRSIDVGRRRYWRMLTRTSGVDFDDHTITECLAVIHTDTVCVWEFDDPLQYLYSDEFRGLMANLAGTIDGFTSEFPRLSRIDTTSSNFSTPRTGPRRLLTPFTPPFEAGPGLVPRTRQSYQQPPNAHHKFMAYTVDLVHVLEILSSLTANSNEKKLTRGAVSSAFDVYYDLEMRYNVHRRIKGFDYRIPGRNTVLDEIISLVTMSPINDNDISSALQNIPLESLAKDEWLVGLEGIIACRRSALQLTPEGHPNRAVSLANLLCSLHERFTREHRMEDLQEIITLRRSALQLTPEGHPERVVSLVNLADSLHERFERQSGMDDLQEIIDLRRSALKLTPKWHPKHAVALVNLADSLHERFKRQSGMDDLQEIITLRRSALQLTPEGHPECVVALVDLADSLHERFERQSGIYDLWEIIDLRRSALKLTPEGHPKYAVALVNLADSLHERFKRWGGMEDLQEIIDLRRSALKLTPKWHPKHAVTLVDLVDGLHERFERQSGMDDLQEIIAFRRSALQLTPEGHPERIVFLANLLCSLHERFTREHRMEDLQEIIAFRRSALQLTPKGHPERIVFLGKLADSLHERFKRKGGMEDLQEIIAFRRSALQLTPEGHPERIVFLGKLADSLYECFKREGRMEDLREIITLRRSTLQLALEGHPKRVVSLGKLADSLHERFKREGGMEDLQETITLRRSALQLPPEGHPARAVSPINLADGSHECFKREGGMEDLQEIIALQRSALQLTPEGHPERVVSLVNLADSFRERFKREGDMEDLQEIIALQHSALKCTPKGHPKHVVSLVNLADSLHERFKREGGKEDLLEIIVLRRSALQFTPLGHPGRFLSLVNLSNSLHERFIKGGTLADLDEIIAFRRAASECTAPTPSDRCMLLLDLANSLREKYQRLGLDADLGEAIRYACAASVRCPSEQDASCRDCVAGCVDLKVKKSRLPAPTVATTDPGVRPSGVKRTVQRIVAEITQTLPLRLLNTYTGVLCDRDAQISCFQDSAQYDELQSSTYDSPECESSIRKAISKYFGYTTLSHRWGAGEPLLRNIQGVNVYSLDDREGFAKLQSFCALTLRHGYRWAWSDTCCIDKDSSSELQEAIGSMFAWYRNSALTIVYLSDVSGTTSFADSIWFKRGWTLQELLASPRVLFYTQDWSLYMNCTSPNHKSDAAILTELQEATGIAELQLKHFSPGVLDVRSKLQWASTRYTTRAEDVAYSLFGIFQVSLPVIYGENTPGALGRLLAEIVSRSGDVSVLDWVGEASSFHSCFPTGLAPYRTRSWMQSVPSGPSKHHDVDPEKGRELYNALARLSSPRFVAGRLELPCIVHRVASVKLLETSSATSYHDYELVASGLVPLKLKLSSRLQEGSGAGLPYVLVRPWSPKLLDLLARDDVPGSLLEWLRQPFSALLLQSPLHTEYKRIASDCSIIASVEDLASVVHSECQTLEIV